MDQKKKVKNKPEMKYLTLITAMFLESYFNYLNNVATYPIFYSNSYLYTG